MYSIPLNFAVPDDEDDGIVMEDIDYSDPSMDPLVDTVMIFADIAIVDHNNNLKWCVVVISNYRIYLNRCCHELNW